MNALEVSLPKAIGTGIYPPGATYGPRTMRDFAFIWLIEGDAEYHWGTNITAAPAGSIVLCRPSAIDFFRWDPHRRTNHGYMHFDVLSVPEEWLDMSRWPLVRQPREGDILRPLFQHLIEWQGSGNPLQCKLAISTMLTAFLSGEIAGGHLPYENLPETVERAWTFIQKSLAEIPAAPIRLADLANAACVTPEYLCRVFQTSIGWSPVETVRLARLDNAASLVARSNYSISEIADLCGFSSAVHFSQSFKLAFGQSPRNLRNAIQAGATPPHPRLYRLTFGR